MQGISLRIISLLCLSVTVAGSAQEDRQTALALWEEAIAARGGRERLAGIRSFAILQKTRFRGFMTRDVARGKVDQIVCELPDKWWEFLDYRPGLMGYSVEVVDTLTGLGWGSLSGTPARPFRRPDTNAAYRMRQLQYVYFLQTRSVQPRPRGASRVRLGLRSADRVDTVMDDESVVFYFDPATHLPLRIETSRKITLKPPRPEVKGTGQLKYKSSSCLTIRKSEGSWCLDESSSVVMLPNPASKSTLTTPHRFSLAYRRRTRRLIPGAGAPI